MRLQGDPSPNHQELMSIVLPLIDVKTFTSIDRQGKVTTLLKQREELGCSFLSAASIRTELDHARRSVPSVRAFGRGNVVGDDLATAPAAATIRQGKIPAITIPAPLNIRIAGPTMPLRLGCTPR